MSLFLKFVSSLLSPKRAVSLLPHCWESLCMRLHRLGAPRWLRQDSIRLQCRRPEFSPWAGKTPGDGDSYPLQYPCLENPTDRGDGPATVHGTAEGRLWLTLSLLNVLLYGGC